MTTTDTDRSAAASSPAAREATGEGNATAPSPVVWKSLIEALAAAQGEIENAPLNKQNPHFQSKYADLAAIRNAVTPALTKHGLAVTQVTQITEAGALILITRLMHTSGETLESVYPLPTEIGRPQVMGSALTYARRYTLAAMIGIGSDEDDDAEGAERPASNGNASNARSRKNSDPGLAKGQKTKHGDTKSALKAKLHEFIRDVMSASDEGELDGVIAGYGDMIEDVRHHFPSWWEGSANDDGEPPVRIIERRRKDLQAQAAEPRHEESSLPDQILESMRNNQSVEALKAWKANNRVVVSDLPEPDKQRIQDAYTRYLHDLSQAPHPEAAQ